MRVMGGTDQMMKRTFGRIQLLPSVSANHLVGIPAWHMKSAVRRIVYK
jgi:hypothetical protein